YYLERLYPLLIAVKLLRPGPPSSESAGNASTVQSKPALIGEAIERIGFNPLYKSGVIIRKKIRKRHLSRLTQVGFYGKRLVARVGLPSSRSVKTGQIPSTRFRSSTGRNSSNWDFEASLSSM